MANSMLSRRDFLWLTAGLAGSGVLAACAPAAEPTEEAPAATAVPEVDEPAPTVAPSGPEPAEITVIGRNVTIPTILELAADWMDDTGITVEPLEIGGELELKIMESMATGTHLADVQLHGMNFGADLYSQGYYLAIDELVKEAIDWDDLMPVYAERVAAWEGVSYGIPFDGDNMTLGFRRDILQNEEYAGDFASDYGYDFDIDTGPKTWDQHRDYAEFFTGWDWHGDGEESYGFAHMWARGGGSFNSFFNRAAAYAKHPDVPDFFFDLDSGAPLVNTPPFVRAMEEWIDEMHNFAPPGGANMAWGDCLNLWYQGRVFMQAWWGDHGKDGQDEENSQIKGKMGFSMTPGSKEVYNQKTETWETMQEINYGPYLGYNGRSFGVAATTEYPDQSWEFLKFACSPEITLIVSYTPLAGMEPVRYSQLDPEEWVNSPFAWDRAEADRWLKAIGDTINHPNVIADLRLPGWGEYRDPLELAISLVASGESTAREALDECALTWDEVTERVGGRDKQMQYYRDIAESV